VAIISGIAWDHINVFPTFEDYVEQFRIFVNLVSDGGALIYCRDDKAVEVVCLSAKESFTKIPYSLPLFEITDGKTYIIEGKVKHPLEVFGRHNLLNITGAKLVCKELGVNNEMFYKAISSFKGASKRLETIGSNDSVIVYKDFAHSPSKLKATTTAVKEQFPGRKLVACLELHTFSSLTAEFLKEYKGTIDAADIAIVYFNAHTIAHKKLPPITAEQVKLSFGREDIRIYNDSSFLTDDLLKMQWKNANLLLMSSGNFDGVDMNNLANRIVSS
jgi:UDP-N-acetylmuramate: L-alanyl-gamma-D-glutamyl-meso-diaminopimelate ligase